MKRIWTKFGRYFVNDANVINRYKQICCGGYNSTELGVLGQFGVTIYHSNICIKGVI